MFQSSIKLLFTLCVSCLSGSLLGQDLEKDISDITEAINSASSVSIEVDIKAYSRKGGSVLYQGNASLVKSAESTKSVLSEMEFVNTPSYEIRIDHEEKSILILKKERPSGSNSPKKQEFDFDVETLKKLLKNEETSVERPKIKLISSSGGVKKYSIKGSPGISELILELDMAKKKILAVRMEYGDGGSTGQYVVLNYSKFSYNLDISSSFDLANYFTVKDNTYVLSSQLKGYHLYTEL